ncbi:tetratricopeptide repeat protein [Spirillospora sp. NPDC048911]|uniref:tetratricopeptide repeat protein n=1 Tax=Spirillospora sp. NPDC048911 TaxID=3364527 RepID=UPI00371CCB6D
MLARAGLHDASVPGRLERLIAAVPELALVTVQAAPQSEHPQPLVDALRHLLDTTPVDERRLALFAELSDALPRQTRLFSSVAVTIAQILVGVRRTLAESDPDTYLPDLAQSLNTLANRLASVGRNEEALAPAQEAVAIRRGLSSAKPDAHIPALAQSLVTLAGRSADVGQRHESRESAEEAVQLYQVLAGTEPEVHLPDFAEALNTLAISLANSGRQAEALTRAEEAFVIRQELVQTNPSAYLPDLARSMNTMTVQLTAMGHSVQAHETAERATTLFRSLAGMDSDAHLADLATSLGDLTRTLISMNRAEEALEPAREAVLLRRRLAENAPDAFAAPLADSLTALADLLAATGWPGGALRLAAEATRRWRSLAEHSDAHRPRLATALAVNAHALARQDRTDEAMTLGREACDHYRASTRSDAAHSRIFAVLTYVLVKDATPGQTILPLLDSLDPDRMLPAHADELLARTAGELRKAHESDPASVKQTIASLGCPDTLDPLA